MKRFWTDVAVAPQPAGWQVTLDGRPIRTAARAPQILPTRALAELLAAEWAGQGPEVDPQAFPARDLADYAIDVVAHDPAATAATLIAYAETDTLCYRADPDEPLHRAQHATWEPLLTATETREGIAFTRVCGVIHRPQPPATLAHLAARLAALPPFVLAALTTMASLAASLVVALAALDPTADLAALWAAACLEEEWQADLWGRDPEAEARRAGRAQSFAAAARFAQLAVAEG